ncbi:MAG: hypothetical protein KIY12_08565 [Thermoplasmata archaeon]|uniref:Uncharacterized protein n=1 Tax=Candidatus Sysuiplasma superficiale TaxID=2823368 RepID=A0A8J8CGU6_9ARCH|nr:hypothetical protein [Candidatus Sysuiplasma superficiale]
MYEEYSGTKGGVVPFCAEYAVGQRFRITGETTSEVFLVRHGRKVMLCGIVRIGDNSGNGTAPESDNEEADEDAGEEYETAPGSMPKAITNGNNFSGSRADAQAGRKMEVQPES